jgi:hypothetical protein
MGRDSTTAPGIYGPVPLSIEHNRVLVGLRDAKRGDRRLLRRRYGPALRFWNFP